jgi:hypothetical protein
MSTNLATVLDVVKLIFPEAARRWDGYDYSVHGPVSLDDLSEVHVVLKNKNGATFAMRLPLRGASIATEQLTGGKEGGVENVPIKR